MLTEDFVVAVCGPPLASNTAISKDAGIYTYQLAPQLQARSVLKKSSAPVHGMAVSRSHIFTAQKDKAHVHVYSRERGNQEALVAFSERITAVAMVGDVLVLGTGEGRMILWEVSFFFFVLLFSFLLLFLSLLKKEKKRKKKTVGGQTGDADGYWCGYAGLEYSVQEAEHS